MGLLKKINKPVETVLTTSHNNYIRASLEPNFVEQIETRLKDITNQNSIKEANQLMAIAYKYGTPGETLRNKFALSYNKCVCCETAKPGEETPLVTAGGLLIPVCTECQATDYVVNINWYEVAKIYSNYAKNTEGAANYYDEIR